MLRQTLIILFTSLIFLGCKDELDIEELTELTTPWQEDDRFLFETKVQFNTHADGERIHFMGRNHFSTIELREGDTIEYVQHAIHWLEHNQNARMPITDELFVTANQNTVRIASTLDPVLQGASQFIQLREIDPEFTHIDFPSFWLSEAMAVNENNVCLIPYQYRSDDNTGGIRVLKVQVAFNNDFMEVEASARFTISDNGFPIRSIYTMGDDFIITNDRKVYVLTSGNEIIETADFPVSNIFEVGDQVFGIRGNQLYRFTEGFTWTEAATVDRNLELVSYDVVEGKTIGVYNSQIFLFELDGDDLQITELNNDGLFGHEITSVDAFNGTVYVATLSGVFVKNLEDFWEERVREEG